jgi:hypothetical protein
VPRRGEGKEESKTTQYERRFGDDRRNTRSRLLRPWFDFGRDLGGFRNVYRAEIKTIKERKHMNQGKKYTLKQIQEICKNFNFTPTEGIGGGRIEIAKDFDDDAFGFFTPKDGGYSFRFYKP